MDLLFPSKKEGIQEPPPKKEEIQEPTSKKEEIQEPTSKKLKTSSNEQPKKEGEWLTSDTYRFIWIGITRIKPLPYQTIPMYIVCCENHVHHATS